MGKQKRNDSILFSVVQALGEDSTWMLFTIPTMYQ